MDIRASTAGDIEAVCTVHGQAFGDEEGPAIVQLVRDLLVGDSQPPTLSLVAEHDGTIIGSVIFSPVEISGNDTVSGYILSPLAVLPGQQRRGVGRTLIMQGVQRLREDGHDLVLVLGDPRYYSRWGFVDSHSLQPPHRVVFPGAWRAIALREGILDRMTGTVTCVPCLNAAQYW